MQSSTLNPRFTIPLAVLVLLALGRVCTHDFVQWDDHVTIANNPAFNPPDAGRILQYWWTPAESLYIPLTYSVWGGLAFIAHVDQADEFGSTLNPWVYHSANLLIHLAAVLVVYAIIRRLTAQDWAAFFGTAVFALHPVQVETVAWASGTKDLLCGLFIALSVLALIVYRQSGASRGRQAWIYLAILLACLSKPTGVVAPLIAGVVDLLVLRTSARRSLALLAPGLTLSIAFATVGKLVQPPVAAEIPSLWIRPLISTDALAFYLLKLFCPINLAIDYGRLPDLVVQQRWLYWTWIAPATVAILLWVFRRRVPLVVAGALVAGIGVAPVLGMIPFTFQQYSTVGDHYIYPSMIGVAIVLSACFAQTSKTSRAAGIVVVIALAAISAVAAGRWKNNVTLANHTLDVNPRSFAAYTLRATDSVRHNDARAGERDLRKAIQLNPNYAFARLSLAQLLLKQGETDSAIAEFEQVFRIYAAQRNYNAKLGSDLAILIAAMLEKQNRPTEAVPILREALRRDPSNERIQGVLNRLSPPQ